VRAQYALTVRTAIGRSCGPSGAEEWASAPRHGRCWFGQRARPSARRPRQRPTIAKERTMKRLSMVLGVGAMALSIAGCGTREEVESLETTQSPLTAG